MRSGVSDLGEAAVGEEDPGIGKSGPGQWLPCGGAESGGEGQVSGGHDPYLRRILQRLYGHYRGDHGSRQIMPAFWIY